MRAFRSTALVVAAILTVVLGARADFSSSGPTLSDRWCLGLPTGQQRVDCLDGLHPGFKVWLAFHVPHLPPPWPWPCILNAESGDTYSENTGNGYFGAAQWLPSTWIAAARYADWPEFTLGGRADLAPPAVQDQVAEAWAAHAGWGQWGTAQRCGV